MTALADELERFSQALALNEGFQLVVLECHDLESWDLYRIFDVVQARVAELRGTPPLVLIYDPYLTTNETGSLRDQAWVEGVLGPLLELPAPTSDGASLVAVIDGTRFGASDGDELPSWMNLFHRLNEQRNELARTLGGTLALALPSALISLFLDEAPDSASIRSGHFQLDRSLLPAAPAQRHPPTPPGYPEYRLEDLYDAALRRRAADPNHDPTERAWAQKHFAIRPPMPEQSQLEDRSRARDARNLAQKALVQLFLSLFSADELRRFLRYSSDGDTLTASLPGASASPASLALEAAQILEQRGFLSDPQFWSRLLDERPRRKTDIDEVRARFQPVAYPMSTTRSSNATNTGEWTVLLTSLDDESHAHLEREFVLLFRALQRVRAPIRLTLTQATATHQLRELLHQHRPQYLVLWSGVPLDPTTHSYLFRLLVTHWDWPRCLLLLVPRANSQAQAFQGTAEQIIALDTQLPESYIDQFLTAFFISSARGRSVEAAFDFASASASASAPSDREQDTPLLVSRYRPPGLKVPRA